MLQWVQREPRFVPQPADWDMDDPHGALWQAVRHLFPDNAQATQADHGCLVVSWRIRDPLRGSTHYAAPIVMRMAPGLLLALWTCDDEDRREIARMQVDAVRDAMAGYDPGSRIPTCDVIVLGDG